MTRALLDDATAGTLRAILAAPALPVGTKTAGPPLTGLLASLPLGPARNAVLGGVRRGNLLTWATSVRCWAWEGHRPPGRTRPLTRASAEFETDEFPGLYDAVLAWEPGIKALVAIPTHRDRLTWEPADRSRVWTVRLAKAVFHEQELIPLEHIPAELNSIMP